MILERGCCKMSHPFFHGLYQSTQQGPHQNEILSTHIQEEVTEGQ